jgi:D-aspartate ligase
MSNNKQPGAIIIEGHVQGLSNTRSLGEKGIEVWVVDKADCVASYSKYCKKFIQCPDFKTDAFVEFLIQTAIQYSLKDWVLIPSNDHAVFSLSRNKERLSKYYRLVTDDWETIQKIYDKSSLLEIAQESGVPIPETIYFTTADEVKAHNITYPVLTKGREGLNFYKSLGRKAFLAHSENELREQLTLIESKVPLKETFTQELIPSDGNNKTISFTAFCIKGEIKTHWTGLKLREHPIQFGTATCAKSVWIPEVLHQSELLLRKLQYTGVCEVEYLLDPRTGTFKLIEINARTWLWVGLAKACGVDYAALLYYYAQGSDVNYPKEYKKDVYWFNPVTDFIYGLIGMLKGVYQIRTLWSFLFEKNKVNALFVKGDRKPGFIYLRNLFLFYKTR